MTHRQTIPVLSESWRLVEELPERGESMSMEEDDAEEWEEEDEITYINLNFTPHLPSTSFKHSTSFQLLALNSPTPYAKVGIQTFIGLHERLLGDELFLSGPNTSNSTSTSTSTTNADDHEEEDTMPTPPPTTTSTSTTTSITPLKPLLTTPHRINFHPITLKSLNTTNNSTDTVISTESNGKGKGKEKGKLKVKEVKEPKKRGRPKGSKTVNRKEVQMEVLGGERMVALAASGSGSGGGVGVEEEEGGDEVGGEVELELEAEPEREVEPEVEAGVEAGGEAVMENEPAEETAPIEKKKARGRPPKVKKT